jgi:hypothetical protein
MVSTPAAPDEAELELEPLPLLQAASRPTATMVAPAAIERTRQGLDDIGVPSFLSALFSSLFSSAWDGRRFGLSEALYRLSVNPRLSYLLRSWSGRARLGGPG